MTPQPKFGNGLWCRLRHRKWHRVTCRHDDIVLGQIVTYACWLCEKCGFGVGCNAEEGR